MVGLNPGSSLVPSGILKQVKDVLKECTSCQSRRGAEDGSGTRLYCRLGRHKPKEDEEFEEDHDDEADDGLFFATSPSSHAKLPKTASKHELVFVCLCSWCTSHFFLPRLILLQRLIDIEISVALSAAGGQQR